MKVPLRGSTPVLAALVAAFLATFFGLRAADGFRAVERDAAALRATARAHGLDLPTVFALREQAGAMTDGEFEARTAAFARLRTGLGEPLAAVAVAGGEPAARAALQLAGGDPEAAWRQFHRQPAAIPGVRFLLMRARFADRAPARD